MQTAVEVQEDDTFVVLYCREIEVGRRRLKKTVLPSVRLGPAFIEVY